MTPTDLEGLLRAVIEQPDDDHVRLVYADALDELPTQRVKCPVASCGVDARKGHIRVNSGRYYVYGEPREKPCPRCNGTGEVVDTFPQERAELIRVQVELYKRSQPVEVYDTAVLTDHASTRSAVTLRYDHGDDYNQLVGRETFLFSQLQRRGLLTGREDYHRGFVRAWTGTADEWFQVEGKLFWHPDQDRPCPPSAHPLRRVVLTTNPGVRSGMNGWMMYAGGVEKPWVQIPVRMGDIWENAFKQLSSAYWPNLAAHLPRPVEGTEVVSDDDVDMWPLSNNSEGI